MPPNPPKPDPLKKPTPPAAGTPAKPAANGQKPAAKPGVTPPKPAAKPAAGKPIAKKTTEPGRHAKSWNPDSGNRKLGQVLIDLGYLDELQFEEIMFEHRSTEQSIERLVVDKGLVTEEQLLGAMAEQHGLKVATLEDIKPSPEAMKLVPDQMASVYKILPLTYEAGTLTVALSDPAALPGLDDLRNFLGIGSVVAVLSTQRAIEELQKNAFAGKPQESIVDLIASLDPDAGSASGHRETSIDLHSLSELADSAPVRKLINMILLMAIRDKASDIHFEPFEEEYKIRCRADGVLYEMVPPPRHLAMAIASRIKVMSNLDIAERRMPQDGRIELNVGGNPVDLRVSILPTMFGESVVIRVLDRSNVGLDLDRIGMEPELLAEFRKQIHKPNGIVLVTGPTGAGKTTTLYSALSELNQIDTKVITTEDPVEYEIDGICQVPINAEIDMTFAAALRAILRQDPDVILVGEIRDLETAQIAIQASLTGHMVFSTLHTNDAPSTITRMRDMGVEPFLLTATVEGILAQRLVRRICTHCKTEYEPGPEQLMELNLRPEDAVGKKFYYGAGCDKCNNLGYKGRMGVYEFMSLNDTMRDMISNGASTDQLRAQMKKQGVSSLRDAGLRALYAGLTSLDEVVRETVIDD